MTKRWSRIGVVTLFCLVAFTASASAEGAWALIEPATVDPERGLWDRFWYRWRYGSGWVVNYFFSSAEACRTVEERWVEESRRIMLGPTRNLRETQRATDMINSRCVPAEALPLFNVRPGSAFPPR